MGKLKYFTPILFVVIIFSIAAIQSGNYKFLSFLLIELILFQILIIYERNKMTVFLFVLQVALLATQLSSYYVTSLPLQALALSNLAEYKDIGIDNILITLSFSIAMFIYLLISLRLKPLPKNKKIIYVLFPFVIVYILGFKQMPSTMAGKAIKEHIKEELIAAQVTPEAISEADKYFSKTWISSSNNNSSFYFKEKPKNIIVIFTEGMSADIVSEQVTPNIFRLQQKSLNVINYYNHTAATYRGIYGQLSSSYVALGGYVKGKGLAELSPEKLQRKLRTNIITLPHILQKYNYETFFIAPNATTDNLSLMLGNMGLQPIGSDNYEHFIPNENPANELTDKQVYDLLWQELQKEHENPFFYGVYTVGTHVGLNSPDKVYGDAQNAYLNKFYNMDYYLGEFIAKFDNSSLKDNTLIIFTADHSTLPEKQFKSTFNTKSDFFVDKIPLIMYNGGKTTSILDAQGKNSLTLTPTLLDILDIDNEPNYFLGTSLFDCQYTSDFNYVSALGQQFIKTPVLKEINDKDIVVKLIKKFYLLTAR